MASCFASVMDEIFPARRTLYQLGELQAEVLLPLANRFIKSHYHESFAWEMSFTLGEMLCDAFGPTFKAGPEWQSGSFLRGFVSTLQPRAFHCPQMRIMKEPDRRVKVPHGVPLALMRVEVTLARGRSGEWAFAPDKQVVNG